MIGNRQLPATRRRLVFPLLLASLLVAATWGPADNAAPTAPLATVGQPIVGVQPAADGASPLGAVMPPSASSPPSSPAIAPSVLTHQPDVLVELEQAGSLDPVATIAARSDVEHVAGARRFDVELLSAPALLGDSEQTVAADEPLALLAVDPVAFRPLAPAVTAQSVGVWKRLLAGDAVIGHEVALQRGLELGDTIIVATDRGQRAYRIGALAAMSKPPLADVVVANTGIGDITDPEWNVAIVAASTGTGSVWLGEQLVTAIGGGSFERLDEPSRRVPGWDALESFSYTDIGEGRIQILGDWVSRFIVTVDLPIVGRTRCNRLMVPQLVAALNEIVQAGLADLIDRAQFGGCWVPRHIDWNVAKPISMHAWGLAIDLNVAGNGLGQVPTMDLRIVDIFQRWGFWWGGWWDRPDGMHFQLNQFVAAD